MTIHFSIQALQIAGFSVLGIIVAWFMTMFSYAQNEFLFSFGVFLLIVSTAGVIFGVCDQVAVWIN